MADSLEHMGNHTMDIVDMSGGVVRVTGIVAMLDSRYPGLALGGRGVEAVGALVSSGDLLAVRLDQIYAVRATMNAKTMLKMLEESYEHEEEVTLGQTLPQFATPVPNH